MDMGLVNDAVKFWNEAWAWGLAGCKYGSKSPVVRDWMLDPNNYRLEHFSVNRSLSSILGKTERYLDPL